MSSNSGNTLYYFTLAMTVLYIILGIFIMLSSGVESLLPGNKKYIIGTLFILYALFRIYRLNRIRNSMKGN